MASPLTVAMLADVSDLNTKSTLAKSIVRDLTATLREQTAGWAGLSEAARSEALPAIQANAAEMQKLKAIIAEASAAAKQHGEAQTGIAAVLGANRSAMMELEHSARAMADGLASGANPLRLIAQESARVIQAATQLNGVNLAAVAGWGAVGAGVLGAAGALVYYAVQVEKAVRDAHELQSAFAAGNFSAPQDTILQWSYDLRAFGNVSEETSQKVIRTLGSMRGATVQSIQALIDVLPLFAKRLGTDLPTAASDAARVLGNVREEGARFLAQINASTAVQNQFQAALARTDGSSFGIVLQELARQALAFGDAEKYAIAQASQLSRASFSPSNKAGGAGQETYNLQLQAERAKQAVQDVAAALAHVDAAQGTVGLEAFRLKAQQVAEDITKTSAQKAAAVEAIWDQAVASGKLVGDELTQAEREQASARVSAATTESGEIIRQAQLTAERAAAAAGAGRAEQVRAEIAAYSETLKSAKLTADAKEELENRVAELQVQLVRRSATESKRSTEERWQADKAAFEQQIEAAHGNYAQQIALIRQEVAEAKRLFGEKSAAAMMAEKAETAAVIAEGQARLKAMEQQLDTEKNLAKAQAAISSIGAKPDVGEFRPDITMVFDDSGLQAKVAAQVAKLKAALDEELAGLQADMQGKLNLAKTLDPGSEEYKALLNSASADYATMASDIKASSDQIIQLNEKAAQTVQQAWQTITGPIGNAFDKIVDDAIGGNERISIAALKAAEGMAQAWIKSLVQVAEKWVATQAIGVFTGKTPGPDASKGGATGAETQQLHSDLQQILAALKAPAKGTAGSAVGGSNSAGGSDGTVAADGSNAVADGGTALLGGGVQAAEKAVATDFLSDVGGDLKSVVSSIFSGVLGLFGFAAGGWDDVPADGTPAILHKREMVLPASLAESVRRMAGASVEGSVPRFASAAAWSGAGGNSSVQNNTGGNIGAIHYSPTFHGAPAGSSADMASLLRSDKRAFASAINEIHLSSYANGGLTLPGRKPWR